MEQLKNRIEALKRNADAIQKKEELEAKHREVVEQGIRNKEQKEMGKMALEERRQREVQEKISTAAVVRRERAMSKSMVQRDLATKKQNEARAAREETAKRKADLESNANKIKANKLKMAMELRKQKQEAAAVKAQLEYEYHAHLN